MNTASDPLAPARRFRRVFVRYGLLVTLILAGGAYAISRDAAHGVLLGGIAGVLGFWIIAIRLEKVALTTPQKVHFAALTWTSLRFLLYGVILLRSFYLDREHLHGLIGAVVGIFAVRFVMIGLGITNLDRPKNNESNDSEASSDGA